MKKAKKKCPTDLQLLRFHRGEEVVSERWQSHIKDCPSCQQKLAALDRLDQIMAQPSEWD